MQIFYEEAICESSPAPFFPCIVVIQARMGSSRLPGKVLKQILGKPLLEFQIERIQAVQLADQIIVATTHKKEDDPIHYLCEKKGIRCFRGSEDDVLSRYYAIASTYKAEVVVRVTGDCPLIDPYIMNRALQCFTHYYDDLDYLSNTLIRTYPRGMDLEIFKFFALEEAYHRSRNPSDKEHVTPYIYEGPSHFRLGNLSYKNNLSNLRLTIDVDEDFQLIKNIVEHIYPIKPLFSLKDIVNALEDYPEWISLNANVKQKSITSS